jgi:PAS domain S-box-containing protein
MTSSSALYFLALAALAQLAAWLAVTAYRRPDQPRTWAFSPLMVAVTARTVMAILGYLTPTLSGKLLAARLEWISFAAIGPLWLAFALQQTGRSHLLQRGHRALLAAPAVITAGLVLTNEAHSLIWTRASLDPANPALLLLERGPWAQAYSVLHYGFLVGGIVLFIMDFARAPQAFRLPASILMAGALVPLVGNAVTLAGVAPRFQFDATVVTLPIAMAVFALGLYRYAGLELTPVAARVVMDNLREAVIVLDAAGRLMDLNAAGRRLLGLGDEALGRPALEVLRPAETWRKYIGLSEAQAEIELGEGEAGRGRWFQLALTPLRDARDKPLGAIALLHDISQERALLRMRDDLTHMLVHDLRNPFSSIYSALQLIDTLLQEQAAGLSAEAAGLAMSHDEALQGAIGIALQSSHRAQEMLDSLLDLNRLEGGQMPVEPVTLETAQVARDVIQEMAPYARQRGLALDLAIADNLPDGYADRDLLDRVIRNLVANAIKFTPAGGQVRLGAQAADSVITVSVSDTGPGIPELVKKRLFQKFARGPGPAHGSGLGLAFCRLAVEAMGGRIWADSAPGQGAAFHFTIPRAAGGPAPPPAAPGAPSPTPPGGSQAVSNP